MPSSNNYLDEVYRACSPDEPLPAKDKRYVDLSSLRGTGIIHESICRTIQLAEKNKYDKILLTGFRGSGKSTELLKLKQTLEENNYFVIYFDVEDYLDLSDINYLDVLLNIANVTFEQVKNKISIKQSLLDDLHSWFSNRVVDKVETKDENLKVGAGAKINVGFEILAQLFTNINAKVKLSNVSRVTIRQELEKELPTFINKLNVILTAVRSSIKKELKKDDFVIIVDGLEKLYFKQVTTKNNELISNFQEMFVYHSEQLKSPQCHIIYTVPVSLLSNHNLGNDFDNIIVLPMVRVDKEGITTLTKLLQIRFDINKAFANPNDLTELIEISGGVLRDLMKLIRTATNTSNNQIGRDEIENAKKLLIQEYSRLVDEDDIEALISVHKNRRYTANIKYSKLLYLKLILEYGNGERWADIHPAVKEIKWIKQLISKIQQA